MFCDAVGSMQYRISAGCPVTVPPTTMPTPAPPMYTVQDVQQVKDMFPDIDEDVIKSILDANQGNKDMTINQLLAMQEP